MTYPSPARPRPQRLAAVLFDVDGTLAETEELHRRAFNETFAEAGLDWSWDQKLYKALLRVTGGKERMRASMAEYRPEALAPAGATDTPDLHEEKRMNATRRSRPADAPALAPRHPAADRRDSKAGLALAIATTTSRENVESLLKSAGPDLADRFSVIVAGDQIARKKPDPAVYLEALARLR